MKKHDEGYVLAYVTVVLLIFCLVATVILTGALRNLNNQQNTNEQMKAQYLAEGEIEKVISQLASETKFEVGKQVGDTQVSCEKIAQTDEQTVIVTLSAQALDNNVSVKVTCEILLKGTFDTSQDTDQNVTSCTIKGLSQYKYQSYQIGGASQ